MLRSYLFYIILDEISANIDLAWRWNQRYGNRDMFNAYSDGHARVIFLRDASAKTRRKVRQETKIFPNFRTSRVLWSRCVSAVITIRAIPFVLFRASGFVCAADSRPCHRLLPVLICLYPAFRVPSPSPHATLCTFSPPPHTMNCVCIQLYTPPSPLLHNGIMV